MAVEVRMKEIEKEIQNPSSFVYRLACSDALSCAIKNFIPNFSNQNTTARHTQPQNSSSSKGPEYHGGGSVDERIEKEI